MCQAGCVGDEHLANFVLDDSPVEDVKLVEEPKK